MAPPYDPEVGVIDHPFYGPVNVPDNQLPGGTPSTSAVLDDTPTQVSANPNSSLARETLNSSITDPKAQLENKDLTLTPDLLELQDNELAYSLENQAPEQEKDPVKQAALLAANKTLLTEAAQAEAVGPVQVAQVPQTQLEQASTANEDVDAQVQTAGTTLLAPTAQSDPASTITPAEAKSIELAEAGRVKAMTAAAATLPEAEQLRIASDVSTAIMEVAQLPAAEQAQAQSDIMAQAYEASLLDATEMAVTLQQLKAEEPMQAASMTTEINELLDGMEDGQVPLWAKPAVTLVERQLAARGIGASSIGRDSLFNAIINAAIPIAQQNAVFIQDANKTNYNAKVQAIFSDVGIRNSAKQFNATSQNQANQFNASLRSQVDLANASRKDAMSQFNASQLNDFMKTQAALIQDASKTNAASTNQMRQFNAQRQDLLLQFNAGQKNDFAKVRASLNQQTALANLEVEAAAARQDATAFNSNQELQAQLDQQSELANQESQDRINSLNVQLEAARQQFNAAQDNQKNLAQGQLSQQVKLSNAQMSNDIAKLNSQIAAETDKFNSSQINQRNLAQGQLSQQVNLSQAEMENRASILDTQLADERSKFNASQMNDFKKSQAAMDQQVTLANFSAFNVQEQFNANAANKASQFWGDLNQQRELFNSQQATAITQSNLQWRRQLNQTNTVISNQALQTNVQNAFNLNNQALSFLWQEERDLAQWNFQASESAKDRRNRLEATVMANEAGMAAAGGAFIANITSGLTALDKLFS